MAVLVILMLALTKVFNEATSSFRKGTTTVKRNSAAQVTLDIITKDLEGLVIDKRLACYKAANVFDTSGFGFDEIYFVTTQGDPNDGRAYQMVHYYIKTNDTIHGYRTFQLWRGVAAFKEASQRNVDVMGDQKEWWLQETWTGGSVEFANAFNPPEMLVDNLTRLDFYIHGNNGESLQSSPSQNWNYFNSNEDIPEGAANPFYASNTLPAAIDVYIAVTSDEAARKGGYSLLIAGAEQNGRDLLVRESNVLLTRIFPVAGPVSALHPLE